MAGNNTVRGQTVISKAIMILEAFAGDRTELSLSDLCRSTGLPSSTLHRLAQELVSWGGLERTPQGRYVVGIRLWEIATRSGRSYGLREAAMPFLQSLFDVTREHVQLAVLDGHDALLVEKISGARAILTVAKVGGRLPLHATAVGKVLLAWAPRETQLTVLRSTLPRYTPQTITTEFDLRRELAAVRRQGFAMAREEMSVETVSCAAPIVGPTPSDLAAVSIVMPVGARPLKELETAVLAAGRGITRALTADQPHDTPGQPHDTPGPPPKTRHGRFPLNGTIVVERGALSQQ